jgi:hypothetical protein
VYLPQGMAYAILNPPEADKIGFDWVCFEQ